MISVVPAAETDEKITDFMVTTGGDTNVLGLVVFSVVLGLVIGNMGEEGLPFKNVVDSLQAAILRVVTLVIWLAAAGVVIHTVIIHTVIIHTSSCRVLHWTLLC